MISKHNIDNTQQTFSLDTFKEKFSPDKMCNFYLQDDLHNEKRLNHYLVKQPNDNCFYVEGLHDNLKQFIYVCFYQALQNISDTNKRYVYLTFDNEPVKAGDSQRVHGLHIDGLQGDEVPEKVSNCFQFICFDSLPTLFADQTFKTNNLCLSKDNIFDALGSQVNKNNVYHTKENTIYFMNPYMVHTADKSNKDCKRLFVRLYFSHLPITSIKATINPNIDYNFKPHTTSGDIPKHLK